jgi:anti-sigma-K factor RskA
MIDERLQDLAAEYALDALDPSAARAFEAELIRNPELRGLTDELREAAAALAHAAPRKLPSPELRERVMSSVRAEAAAAAPPHKVATPETSAARTLLPWALAAGFAVTATALWFELGQWRSEALSSRREIVELRNRDTFAKIKIASLSAQVEAFTKSSAVIVWDAERQRGVIRLANLPRPEAGRDYQLWVIDPKYADPVNGGVVPVDEHGYARVSFTPDQPVRRADKFAISIEPTGGVPKATGPIVMLGD